MLSLLYGPALASMNDYWKTITLTRWTFVGTVMFLLFNKLSRFAIAFLPWSKCLLISWLQSPSAVLLESPKIKSLTVSTVSPSICHKVMGPDAMIFVSWMFIIRCGKYESFPGVSVVKNPPAIQETLVWSLGPKDPLEKKMATHSSILAWKIPWTEEPGVLQSIGMQRVRHNLETEYIHTHTHTHTHTHGRNAGHLKFSLAQCALFDFSYFSYMLFILDSFCCCAFMFKHLFLILCLFKHLPHAVHVSFQTLKVFP